MLLLVPLPCCRKYVCSLRTSTGSSTDFLYCGCSLIAPSVVLTAAHCLASTDLRTPWVEVGVLAVPCVLFVPEGCQRAAVNDWHRLPKRC